MKKLALKEVIDLKEGKKLGVLGQADINFDPESGQIISLVIFNRSLFQTKSELVIDWSQVQAIGEDTILINH
ncbi:YlmC/YmxH family sporulation protein [Halobacillus sp. Marseille-Q1614]|uniref:YlmC/YmxH family sporulation protein n=1 Tax=Halobacillus sp. Marseille-Q1614 TaxID=2709134 RepID=UPI0020C270F9|nr:YlmC/YmxH family sporulation protein [Halobacillus sp. Marseille-Q1614]